MTLRLSKGSDNARGRVRWESSSESLYGGKQDKVQAINFANTINTFAHSLGPCVVIVICCSKLILEQHKLLAPKIHCGCLLYYTWEFLKPSATMPPFSQEWSRYQTQLTPLLYHQGSCWVGWSQPRSFGHKTCSCLTPEEGMQGERGWSHECFRWKETFALRGHSRR